MFLEMAIGDAYGAGFEFNGRPFVNGFHDMKTYHKSTIDNIEAGSYTDDTQMSIAIAELLLSNEEFTKENVAKYILNTFKRDIRDCYNLTFFDFLKNTKTPEEFIKNIRSKNRDTNGCLTRSIPIGYLNDFDKIKEFSYIQASVTHDSDIAKKCSHAIAYTAHYLRTNDNIDFLYLLDEIEYDVGLYIDSTKSSEISMYAKDTVNAVFSILSLVDNMKDALDLTIRMGGDTDSVGALVLGLASLNSYYDKNIPQKLIDGIENGKYGSNYLKKLDLDVLSYK